MATEDTWLDIIRKSEVKLLTNMVVDEALLNDLNALKVLPQMAVKVLKGMIRKESPPVVVSKLLDNLKKRSFDDFQQFCKALNADQPHIVANYLSTLKPVEDSIAEPTPVGKLRAISNGVKECLTKYSNEIIEDLDCDEGLLADIEVRKIFTDVQLCKLRHALQPERSSLIVEMLNHSSELNFLNFCEALKVNKLEFIVSKWLTPCEEMRLYEPVGGLKVPAGTREFFKKCQKQVLENAAYEFNGKPRGRVVIINNHKFLNNELKPRDGSDEDVKNVDLLFRNLGFETAIHLDKDASEMLEILVEERNSDYHIDKNMFVLFVMSHGIGDAVCGSDNETLPVKQITALFNNSNCPNLREKPKIFFVQACRGTAKPIDTPLRETEVLLYTDAVPVRRIVCQETERAINEDADIATVYSTVENQVAWRHTKSGSCFIKDLVDVITEKACKSDLLGMITDTFSRLHQNNLTDESQIGQRVDTLRKKVYLLP